MVSIPPVRMMTPRVTFTGGEIAPNVAADLSSTKVNPDETLNLLYRSLPVGAERKLENFNGERKISVFRGDGFMNKITQRLKEPFITFIQGMQNIGSEEKPKLVTSSIVLDVPNKKDALEIHYYVPGDSLKGVFINLFREDYQTLVRHFANLEELRHDPDIIRIVGQWLSKTRK